MKTVLKILLAPFLWVAQSCSPLGSPVDDELSKNHYYNNSKSDVIYSMNGNWFGIGKTEMNVDAKSFKVLSEYFSKDKNQIYFMANVVKHPDVDISSFTSNTTNLKHDIGVDKNSVYYVEKNNLRIIPNANPKSYQKLNISWGKDRENYFYEHKKVSVDYNSFKMLNRQFSIDNDSVYVHHYGDFKSIDADVTSFKILEKSDYAFDNSRIYYFYIADNEFGYELLEIPYILGSKMELYNKNYLRIDDKVYFMGQPVPGVAINSFKILSDVYAKDSVHVYFNGKIISEADTKTFHIPTGEFVPEDKNGSYIGGKLKSKS
ncbi:DKNYY domain-containing protein [Aureibaculum sp. 2210JD6-5]|uniref:DKNYY domain-containing protein n=1 Tax=Aureibaculum sp. 2210JD6-5 TaxID=3103957 RepID=UPI002AACFBBB|nr:DKNYY domain-containing protein [Aureibaculum sp. 2210JD6-5]MDY7395816.1 DKNYY domain-containing protein [Aureibaculum sp. 2210JD6-5]